MLLYFLRFTNVAAMWIVLCNSICISGNCYNGMSVSHHCPTCVHVVQCAEVRDSEASAIRASDDLRFRGRFPQQQVACFHRDIKLHFLYNAQGDTFLTPCWCIWWYYYAEYKFVTQLWTVLPCAFRWHVSA